jgi:hypothetical protein
MTLSSDNRSHRNLVNISTPDFLSGDLFPPNKMPVEEFLIVELSSTLFAMSLALRIEFQNQGQQTPNQTHTYRSFNVAFPDIAPKIATPSRKIAEFSLRALISTVQFSA